MRTHPALFLAALMSFLAAGCGGSSGSGSSSKWKLQAGKNASPVSVSQVDGGFTVSASAEDAAWTFESVKGDFVLTAKVVTPESENVMAGLLVLEGLLETIYTNPQVSIFIQHEGMMFGGGLWTNGGWQGVDFSISGGTAPRYVRLERIGNQFTGYYSEEGTDWQPLLANPSVEVALAEEVNAGVYVSAGEAATIRFDGVGVEGG